MTYGWASSVGNSGGLDDSSAGSSGEGKKGYDLESYKDTAFISLYLNFF